jgi:AcrR family transcriptional regulator
MLNDNTIDSQPDIRVKSLRYGELDRSVVVAAAVRVAERGGVRSVTVRALATELGLSTTAMYRYVDGKAELLNLIAEATLASTGIGAVAAANSRGREQRAQGDAENRRHRRCATDSTRERCSATS